MTTSERTMPGIVIAELESTLDPRTRDLLERRRRRVHRRGWLVRRALAFADVVGLTAAFFLALWLFGGDSAIAVENRIDPQVEALVFLLTLPVWIVMAKLYGLYDRDEARTDHSTVDDLGGVFHMVTVGALGVFLIGWGTRFADPELDKFIAFWVLAVAFVCTLRATARVFCRRRLEYLQNTVIVGAGNVGQLIAKKYHQHPEYGINLVGFVDSDPKTRREDLGHLTLLGGPERLGELIELFDVERVVIAFSNESHEQTIDLIRQLKGHNVQVDIVPRFFEVIGPGVGVHAVEGLPMLGLPPPRLSRSSRFLKRTMDMVLTIPGLIIISPLLLAIAAAIKLDSRGPVLFRQVRMGASGPFRIWKFRTMWSDADERKHEFAHMNKHLGPGGDPRMFKIEKDPRVTRVGLFLRRLSLDELPQLLNVVAGEMSLVGPRPLILEEDCEILEWGRRRLDLKPGITGLWQSLGRDAIPFEEMVRFDYDYVTSWTLARDLRLLLRTIATVVRAGALALRFRIT